ncbi:[acyl-carrier-protein] S-malonyltransferase [Clostridium cavendishii DSM 21758]|uniref:Malonyl CoA-acyl carrier protein transacylase n=1 Tax=Clostridium cavendishii DSM 21758 TaxID=1121302 RepID=A0A1M6MT92_9CLOT|nr:ACP S-malonyltransferase [Clostridium cavendishii]SHJ86677.1 [acyl-carrier-protein] S-malonyltransferase [Clostridium cavendishii DSM 21758]
MNTLFMFPGHGAQYTGMGYELCNNFDIANRTLEEAEDFLKVNLRKLCFNKEYSKELNKAHNAQFAIFAVGVAAYRVLYNETGIIPQIGIGHSLGELTALTCANAVDYKDMLLILKARTKIIETHIQKNNGTMMWVVNLNHLEVEKLCKEQQEKGYEVYISAVNSPHHVAISGEMKSIMRTARKLERMGAIVYPLNIDGPIHSILMKEAADKFMNELVKYSFNPFKFPIISSMTALPYNGCGDIPGTLAQCISSRIKWNDCIQYALNNHIYNAVEIGSKNILSFLMKNTTEQIKTYNFHLPADLEKIRKMI